MQNLCEMFFYLCSGHDVRWLNDVQEAAVVRLVNGHTPVVEDEELLAVTEDVPFGRPRLSRNGKRKKEKKNN